MNNKIIGNLISIVGIALIFYTTNWIANPINEFTFFSIGFWSGTLGISLLITGLRIIIGKKENKEVKK